MSNPSAQQAAPTADGAGSRHLQAGIERRTLAAEAAQSVIDQFFIDRGFGTIADGRELARDITRRLDAEGRLR
ncbi:MULTISPECIES: hypothetical protein [Mycolicibacterium]|uniref:hypothetical protein n=1 Tax=Mycolicibacterium TaxID=1866885 RepID=UPI001CDC4CA6|nr:hypothetical protein [Mycolicibacterium fortuitum]UBV20378.1 hypothetical protein H8Z59_24385 [Mycolicibacterium fortuitum]